MTKKITHGSAFISLDSLGNFELLTNANTFGFGAPAGGQYKLTQIFGGAQLIGQTSGQGGFLSLFSKDSDGTDSATMVVYAKGLPDFSTAAEDLQMGWIAAESKFVVETGFFGGGIARPLTLRTGQQSGPANTAQFVLNTDGSITHGGAIGHQPYIISRRTGQLEVLTIQGQTSGLGSAIELFAKDGDTTDGVYFRAFGRGLPTSIANSEFLFAGWDISASRYHVSTNKTGTGTARSLSIETPGNTDQIRLNTDGSFTHSGTAAQQDYTFTRTGTRDFAIQAQTAGQASYVNIYAKDGDATDNVGLNLFGRGTPTLVTNQEFLEFNYSQANGFYQLVPQATGTGTKRPLNIYTQQAGGTFNTNQLLLNIDGSITNLNIKTTPNNANGVDYLQMVSGSSFYNFFGTPGTAANAVILGVYGLGTSGASANIEGVRLDYNGSSKYELHTIFAGTGIARPLEMFTRNSGGVDNVGQIRLNTDGSVDFGGTLGTNPYKWLVNAGGVLNLQRTNAGQAGLDFYSQLGDGTQSVSSNIYAVGLPNALVNTEFLRTQWTGSKFRLATVATGTGVVRPLSLETSTNPDQLLLNTDGSVTLSTPSTVAHKFMSAFDQVYFNPVAAPAFGTQFNILPFATNGTELCGLAVIGKYDLTFATGTEFCGLNWTPAESAFVLDTQFFIAGAVARPLKLRTQATIAPTFNTDQLVLYPDGSVQVGSGSLSVTTLGAGLKVKGGTNSRIGSATLVAGTVTVANTSVGANDQVHYWVSAAGGVQGFLSYTKINSTSFTITSTSALDTSTLDWEIVEVL